MPVSECDTCLGATGGQERLQIGPGVQGGCESLDTGAGNWTQFSEEQCRLAYTHSTAAARAWQLLVDVSTDSVPLTEREGADVDWNEWASFRVNPLCTS